MGGGRWSLGSAGKGTAVAGGAGGGEIEDGSMVDRERKRKRERKGRFENWELDWFHWRERESVLI